MSMVIVGSGVVKMLLSDYDVDDVFEVNWGKDLVELLSV